MIRLLITSGRGPVECRIAVAKTLNAMRDEADERALRFDAAEGSNPDGRGPFSVLLNVEGNLEAEFERRWAGTVQWICASPVRPGHKRKNWFISVVRLEQAPAVAAAIDPADLRFETLRAGGPGGQHQNTTESAVRAIHLPTGLRIVERGERSQHRNRAVAIERLGRLLALARDMAAMSDRNAVQTNHDNVMRGQPVRCFKGEIFVEIR